jgi:flagellar biosynthesis chaperone FliJ
MAVSRAMRRLLRIRDLQEEQSKLTLESALSELHELEHALTATGEIDRRGRGLIVTSAHTGELTDRLVGIEESHTAQRRIEALEPMIEESKVEVEDLRQEFLTKRIERRQAETLIEEAEAREAIEIGRRGQQSLDDWFRNRMYHGEVAEDTQRTASLARMLPPSVAPQSSTKQPQTIRASDKTGKS